MCRQCDLLSEEAIIGFVGESDGGPGGTIRVGWGEGFLHIGVGWGKCTIRVRWGKCSQAHLAVRFLHILVLGRANAPIRVGWGECTHCKLQK